MTIEEILVAGLPLLSGLAVAFVVGRLGGTRFEVKGIVGPFFGSIAIVFAIYAGLMTNEVWRRIDQANAAISQESDALRSMLRIAAAMEEPGTPIRRAVEDYVATLRRAEWNDMGRALHGPAFEVIDRFYRLALDRELFAGRPAAAQALLNDVEKLRTARVQRHNLSKAGNPFPKIASVFVFGLLTQIAIALVHCGNRRAIYVTAGLFGTAFATLFAVLCLFDPPFANVHVSEHLIDRAPLFDLLDEHLSRMRPAARPTP